MQAQLPRQGDCDLSLQLLKEDKAESAAEDSFTAVEVLGDEWTQLPSQGRCLQSSEDDPQTRLLDAAAPDRAARDVVVRTRHDELDALARLPDPCGRVSRLPLRDSLARRGLRRPRRPRQRACVPRD